MVGEGVNMALDTSHVPSFHRVGESGLESTGRNNPAQRQSWTGPSVVSVDWMPLPVAEGWPRVAKTAWWVTWILPPWAVPLPGGVGGGLAPSPPPNSPLSFGVGRASCSLSHRDSRPSGGPDNDRSIRVCLMNELMSNSTGQDGGIWFLARQPSSFPHLNLNDFIVMESAALQVTHVN